MPKGKTDVKTDVINRVSAECGITKRRAWSVIKAVCHTRCHKRFGIVESGDLQKGDSICLTGLDTFGKVALVKVAPVAKIQEEICGL
jgi:hypothetical protein